MASEPTFTTHLNIGGPRGWTTLCGIESASFVERGSGEEEEVDCKRCLKAMLAERNRNDQP